MNILIIVHNLTGGGAERVAASWANGLSSLHNNVTVLSDFSSPITYELNEKINRLDTPKPITNKILNKILRPFKMYKFYRDNIRKIKPDIVLSVMHINPIILRSALIGINKKPISILTDHNAYERPHYAPLPFIQKVRKFYLNRLYDLVTVLTHRDQEILRSKGFSKVSVMHNPLFLAPTKTILEKENIVLAVGRIDAWKYKGFDLLILAWNNIAYLFPTWKLRIVGSGSKESLKILKGLIKYENSVEFVEYTSNIKEEYEKASIFVLSSRYEGWGLVLTEAMSQGCACIACDYKGRQAEIVSNHETGLLISPNDVEELSRSIELLITDNALRSKLQNAAPHSLDRFSENNVARRWMKIFKEELNTIR